MCLVVAYQRLQTTEKFKMSAQKVAAYKGWSPTRDSNFNDLTENILIFWKSDR